MNDKTIIIRHIDEAGRVGIPKFLREKANIDTTTRLTVSMKETNGNYTIFLKPETPIDIQTATEEYQNVIKANNLEDKYPYKEIVTLLNADKKGV